MPDPKPTTWDDAYAREFFTGVLRELGIPATEQNLRIFQNWSGAENTKAAWNPLATTRRKGVNAGSDFNSVGVRDYPTWEDGVRATALTIANDGYPAMLSALRGERVDHGAIGRDLTRWSGAQGAELDNYVTVVTQGLGQAAAAAEGSATAVSAAPISDPTNVDPSGVYPVITSQYGDPIETATGASAAANPEPQSYDEAAQMLRQWTWQLGQMRASTKENPNPEYDALDDKIWALSQVIDLYPGAPGQTDASSEAFARSLAQGDMDLKEANAAWSRQRDTYQLAQDDARSQLDSILTSDVAGETSRMEREAAKSYGGQANVHVQPGGYVPDDYRSYLDEALARYQAVNPAAGDDNAVTAESPERGASDKQFKGDPAVTGQGGATVETGATDKAAAADSFALPPPSGDAGDDDFVRTAVGATGAADSDHRTRRPATDTTAAAAAFALPPPTGDPGDDAFIRSAMGADNSALYDTGGPPGVSPAGRPPPRIGAGGARSPGDFGGPTPYQPPGPGDPRLGGVRPPGYSGIAPGQPPPRIGAGGARSPGDFGGPRPGSYSGTAPGQPPPRIGAGGARSPGDFGGPRAGSYGVTRPPQAPRGAPPQGPPQMSDSAARQGLMDAAGVAPPGPGDPRRGGVRPPGYSGPAPSRGNPILDWILG